MTKGRGSSWMRRGGVARLAVGIGLLGSLLLPSAASAIDEFPVGVRPGGIATGPDGALWFTEEGLPTPAQSFIGRITTSGQYTHFSISGLVPDQIIAGPDGRMWFTEAGSARIGRIDMAGNVQEFPCGCGSPTGITVGPDGQIWFAASASLAIHRITTGPSPTIDRTYRLPGGSEPSDIESGADGRLWFTESLGNRIGALNPSIPDTGTAPEPAITSYTVGLSPGADPSGLTTTAGGLLWFTEPGIGAIGRITTGGVITEFPGAGGASAIEAAPDGALWYTLGYQAPLPTSPACNTADPGEHAIGRLTTGGTFTNKFPTPTPKSDPSDLTVGPDGALWFSEFCADRIGRIAVALPVDCNAVPTPAGCPPKPVAVLSVSSMRLSPRSFRAASKGGSISAKKKKKGKTGTKVTYGLSRPASTKFTVERAEQGRKSGKKCVKAKRGKKKGKKCTRYVLVKGSFKHAGKAASNKFGFSGRVGSKKLKPGSYRLNARATSGAVKSNVRRASFRIIR
jgi:streptogramin lyase